MVAMRGLSCATTMPPPLQIASSNRDRKWIASFIQPKPPSNAAAKPSTAGKFSVPPRYPFSCPPVGLNAVKSRTNSAPSRPREKDKNSREQRVRSIRKGSTDVVVNGYNSGSDRGRIRQRRLERIDYFHIFASITSAHDNLQMTTFHRYFLEQGV